ncbi:caspase family protein [Clostridium sp. A1-XYC3]|uniref:Caspase family protein n=1 Tax=Clostridium tanneri TaxID=3037988 RepID=A0ABU4JTK4_9CLOT|nr:caspase family protein [Clostridium sp. A1-XYC3]MDW8801468.1 caspase family protein [Clostridium sp. A1-XYC3]
MIIIYKALLIGINKYLDKGIKPLNNVVNDVLGIGRVLGVSSVDYGQSNLIGTQATKVNVIKSLKDFFGNCSKDDTLFLYWAGHGSTSGNGCFITYDTKIYNILNTSIEMDYVKELIENTNAKAVVVMFDCCYSGNVAREASAVRDTMERALKVSGKGKVVIAACDYYQKAYELDKEAHGRFTYHVLQGLEGKAADEKGNVDIFNLYKYISIEMEKYEDVQTPVFNGIVTSPIILNVIEERDSEKTHNINNYKENLTGEEVIQDSGKWCLFNIEAIKYDKVIEKDDLIEVSIVNPLPGQVAIIRNLDTVNPWGNNNISFTFKELCEYVKVENIEINHDNDEIYTIKLRKNKKGSSYGTELSVGLGGFGKSISAKELAELRARRILLGEEKNPEFSRSEWNMINMFVSKNGSTGFEISKPILRDVINKFLNKSVEDWKLIRLYMIYYLIMSYTVEYIEDLKLFVYSGIISKVEFTGIRHRIYSNVDPEKVIVNDRTVF